MYLLLTLIEERNNYMGGDQLNQLISEYISRNIGFIVFVAILIVISIAAIVFGIVMNAISNKKEKKMASGETEGGSTNV